MVWDPLISLFNQTLYHNKLTFATDLKTLYDQRNGSGDSKQSLFPTIVLMLLFSPSAQHRAYIFLCLLTTCNNLPHTVHLCHRNIQLLIYGWCHFSDGSSLISSGCIIVCVCVVLCACGCLCCFFPLPSIFVIFLSSVLGALYCPPGWLRRPCSAPEVPPLKLHLFLHLLLPQPRLRDFYYSTVTFAFLLCNFFFILIEHFIHFLHLVNKDSHT